MSCISAISYFSLNKQSGGGLPWFGFVHDFVVIGEATRTVPDQIQNRYPDIPWRLMAGMRNVVTHDYFQIDLARVWETIQDDLPRLVSQLQEVLECEAREE